MQRYREAIADRSSRFQTSMRENFDSLKLGDMRSMVKEVPKRLRSFLILKLSGTKKSQSNDEQYDDMSNTYGGNYGGSVSGTSTCSKASMCLNEPCIYNSGAESEYNASILSDSASMANAHGSIAPPPPPPPPPVPPPPPPPPPQSYRSNTYKSKKSSVSSKIIPVVENTTEKNEIPIDEDKNGDEVVENEINETSVKYQKKSSKSSHSQCEKYRNSRRL